MPPPLAKAIPQLDEPWRPDDEGGRSLDEPARQSSIPPLFAAEIRINLLQFGPEVGAPNLGARQPGSSCESAQLAGRSASVTSTTVTFGASTALTSSAASTLRQVGDADAVGQAAQPPMQLASMHPAGV